MKKLIIILCVLPCFWSCRGGNEKIASDNKGLLKVGDSATVTYRVVNEVKKRYFFISYFAADDRGYSTYGSFYSIGDSLPSYKALEKTAYDLAKGSEVPFKNFSVVGIFEFKDSTEYNDFKNKK